jgi:uncharacterized protein YbjT (DUF2867 family)
MILIIGATSSIGQAAIPLLREAGYSLRLTSRHPEKLQPFAGDGVELMQVDLLDTASLQRACKGVDQILLTAHSMLGRGKNAASQVDDAGHRAVIDIAKQQGVKHLVYMSVQEATHDNPVPFFRYKAKIEDYIRASGLSYTILRASAFFEPHATLIGNSVLKGGKAMIMGRGDNKRNFIANSDAARYAVIALTNPAARNQTINIGGLDNLTSKEVAAIYARAMGVELKMQVIPRFVPRIMTRLMKPFHPGMSDVMAAVVDSDTRSKAFDPSATLQQYPVTLTRLEDWVKGQAQ